MIEYSYPSYFARYRPPQSREETFRQGMGWLNGIFGRQRCISLGLALLRQCDQKDAQEMIGIFDELQARGFSLESGFVDRSDEEQYVFCEKLKLQNEKGERNKYKLFFAACLADWGQNCLGTTRAMIDREFLFRSCASMEFPLAIGQLACVLYFQDQFDAAFHWAKQGAELDDPEAIFTLGRCFYYGHGMKRKNYGTAIELYRRAADLSHSDAAHELSLCYQYD